MDRPSFFGSYDTATFQFSRSRGSSDWRLAVVCGSAKLRVGARCLHVFGLRGHRRGMTLMRGRLFLGRRALVNACVAPIAAIAAIAAIEADAGDRRIVHDPCLVNVVN